MEYTQSYNLSISENKIVSLGSAIQILPQNIDLSLINHIAVNIDNNILKVVIVTDEDNVDEA